MNLTVLKPTIESRYRDYWGFVTIDRDPSPNSTGNGFLHLAFYSSILERIRLLDNAFSVSVLRAIEASELKHRPGTFHRNPWKGESELNSHDEYLSIAALAHGCGLVGVAERIVTHGFRTNWRFNNQPEIVEPIFMQDDHSRFLGLVPFYKFCAGLKLNFMDHGLLILSVIVACFDKKADANIKTFIQTERLLKGGILLAISSKIWRWNARRKFGTIGAMVREYFGETHPFSQLPWIN